MRKISGVPLLILIIFFLWSHFASASVATINGDALKTSASDPIITDSAGPRATPGLSSAAPDSPAELPKKSPEKKRVPVQLPLKKHIKAMPPSDESSKQLAKKLPARTKVVMDFNQPLTADGPSVVILPLPKDTPASVTPNVAPNIALNVAPTISAGLPALPDSDSYVARPGRLAQAPQQPLTYLAPVAPQPILAPPFIGPEPDRRPKPPAEPSGQTSELSLPISDTRSVSLERESAQRRFFVSGGYLDAKYSRLEGDLKDGATLFGLGASQVISETELRVGVDVVHGLDQAVDLQNIRMLVVHAEAQRTMVKHDGFAIYIGGELGLADVNVTSYRANSASSDISIRENANGFALLAAPEVGGRFQMTSQVSIDLTAQYLILAGGHRLSDVGGLLGQAGLGFRF